MVTVKLMGGLGNQMFQYAFGRSVALNRHEELKLDTSFYDRVHKNTTPRQYELYHLNISGVVIKRGFLSCYLYWIFEKTARRVPSLLPHYFLETEAAYQDKLLDTIGSNAYLDGYWQCEKYFLHNASVIKGEFQVITPQSGINRQWSDKINNCTSVCLHVRRGDYVTNAEANKVHGLLLGDDGLNYYRRAIKYVAERVDSPVFFVFSDDMKWVKENLEIPFETYYMDQNSPEEDYEDLRLMMECKHFIIVNSSFSWWGAWLGDYGEKIVVCPSRWFADPQMKTDIICNGWVEL